MSWDKNTLNFSQIDAVMQVLRDLGESFVLHVLGEVLGNGLNDEVFNGENEEGYPALRMYQIRKLEYKNIVLLEQMQRHPDCDIDDIIMSFKFIKGQEPTDWKIEITLEDDEYDYPPEDDNPEPSAGEYEGDYPGDITEEDYQ
jgi:hypothetical protein